MHTARPRGKAGQWGRRIAARGGKRPFREPERHWKLSPVSDSCPAAQRRAALATHVSGRRCGGRAGEFSSAPSRALGRRRGGRCCTARCKCCEFGWDVASCCGNLRLGFPRKVGNGCSLSPRLLWRSNRGVLLELSGTLSAKSSFLPAEDGLGRRRALCGTAARKRVRLSNLGKRGDALGLHGHCPAPPVLHYLELSGKLRRSFSS